MADLYFACFVITAVAVGLAAWTVRVTSRLSDRTCDVLAVLIVAALFYYISQLWYDLGWADWLPIASVVVLSNWLPILAALLAAVAWRRTRASRPRQVLSAGALCLSGAYALLHPLLGSPPTCGDRWDKFGTCLQTTDNTCSPACAATLLSAHGIDATEQEMAQLCLTRAGTSWQGLYRGLKLKTAGTKWEVEIRRCSADELLQLAGGPMILSVGMEPGMAADPEFTREFGWVPGVNHSVVLVGFNAAGNAIIADPTQELCREHWDRDMLTAFWRGYAFRLVERQ